MTGINRRKMLQSIGAAAAGAAVTALGSKPVLAAFSTPEPGLLYRKYAGTDFHARSSTGQRSYFDNGSIYSVGPNDVFVAPVQLPQHSVIKEIQFSYSITDGVPILVQFFGFDLENHYSGFSETVAPLSPTDPNPLNIRTYTKLGTPVTVDNATWAYALRYAPREGGAAHILWGARVGYQRDAAEGD